MEVLFVMVGSCYVLSDVFWVCIVRWVVVSRFTCGLVSCFEGFEFVDVLMCCGLVVGYWV